MSHDFITPHWAYLKEGCNMYKVLFMVMVAMMFLTFPLLSLADDAVYQMQPEEENLLSELAPEKEPEVASELTQVDRIEVGVETRQLRLMQNQDGEVLSVAHPAGTATPGENTETLPFGKVGHVYKVVFNPGWTPTKNIRKEHFKKTSKEMKKYFPPNMPGNPLGFVKFFIAYESLSLLGIHTSDQPQSIGKRVSHGCTRASDEVGEEMASLILGQNGFDAEEIIRQARSNPKKEIIIKLANQPEIVYLRK